MNSQLNRDSGNLVDAVRRREAAAYYGDPAPVNKYGYTHLPNAGDAEGTDLLVLMHPQAHVDDGNLARIVPQELPPPSSKLVVPRTHTTSYSHNCYHSHAPSSSAMANLQSAISAVLGGTPTGHADIERTKDERFAANGCNKFRGVTRHKRTLRYEAHIWESKKQIYLGGFESELLAARSHDIMALKCKGLDWGALNFEKSDYAQVIEVLDKVQKEDIIYCLRDFSKLFSDGGGAGGDAGSGSGGSGGSLMSIQSHVTTHTGLPSSPVKGGHAPNLKPALKIRKQTEHGHHGQHSGHPLPRTPATPYQDSAFHSDSGGAAPITPKDKPVIDVNLGAEIMAPIDTIGDMETFDSIDTDDVVNATLFDPVQPPCDHGVYLPDMVNSQDARYPFSIFYDSIEDSGYYGGSEVSERLVVGNVLDNAWQWSHC